ncbi:MAG: SDR family oxidoreductase [Smithellaceae bacterium]|jgi:all-trans-retinol dehydrogenase (NAD+)|nr:SDR family oxidoreductase [Smithellaceae bacterium]MDD3848819.1 SDR family oxidoreductase [Smithellaceae bacterium]HOG13455.1 SDR family oxidoreductase [Smithellaceae bacterium]HPL10238.1 SDR family oxidoreductase [Smithellaceae bacterium]
MKDLRGKIALVTGAAMGMGRSLSEDFLREGCAVALVDVNGPALAEAQAELAKTGRCAAFVCDISNREAVYELARRVEKEFGPVDILVNNAGIVKARELLDLSDDDIEKTIRINLTAQFWTCKAFLPSMIQRGGGHIVNFASAGGILSLPNLSAYCASKFGVVGFSDSLRQEMKKHQYNIGVTYVCPNTVNTGMFEGSKMVAGTRMLSASDVTKKVIRAVKRNQAMVAVPDFPVKILTPLTKVLLPIRAMDWLNKIMGMATCNDSWRGRSC